ncbi:MAG: alcohol dehydrogenase catalytic domain-containing protein [Corallococcus sp.]|nr:alcohol dehydrogenase catalytic domain-containing protein [Bacillota bacterium]MCM1533295.1 alcohol dehydrogenase catalytic domain-containing protein [Corallococcus sp.]
MKAAIYNGIKNIEVKDLPTPVCGDNDVIVKNLYAGICGSDINAYLHGGKDVMIYDGYEFGHEMISAVCAKGKNVTGVKIGQRVFPVPTDAKKEGLLRAATVGGFSEYVKIDNFELGRSVALVPDEITDKQAVLLEPLLIGCNAVRPLEVVKGKKAIVYGAGPIGLMSAITLKYLGCDVIICDIIDFRLNIAKELGLYVCNTLTEDYVKKCKQIFGVASGFFGEAIDADYYVDAAGNQAVIDLFFAGAKTYAKLSIVAVHHKPITINPIPVTYDGYQIVGPNGNYHNNMKLGLDILRSHQFDVEKIITHEYSHDAMLDAFEMATDGKKALKVVIKY